MIVSVVVPAHNEEGSLHRLVKRVTTTLIPPTFGHELELVLVDDNSTDATPSICDDLATEYDAITVVHRRSSSGFGNALKDGFRASTGDIVIPFMGDLSDDPADIPKLVSAIEEGYDVAYGSRFVAGGSVNGYPPLKLLYNRAFNNLIRLAFGIRARDVTNAFTAYRREVLSEVKIDRLDSESFDLTAELPLRAHIAGFRSTEVPVDWRSRDAGVSKLNATQKGPLYLKRLGHMFVIGNVSALSDLWDVVTTGSPLRLIAATGFGLLILVGLFSLSGYGDILQTLRRTNPTWLVAAATAFLSSFLFRTWRFRVLLRTSGNLATRGGVFRSIATGWFINFLLPARAGDAARALALKTTEDVPFGGAMGMVAVERALDMLVLGAAMVVVATFLLPQANTEVLALGAIGIAVLISVVLVGVARFEAGLARVVERGVPSLARALESLAEALRRTAENPYAVALALLLTVPVWVLEASTLLFSARAVGVRLEPVIVAVTAIAAFVAQAVPATPAGIGTYEATVAVVLSRFGVPTATGTALALADHVTRALIIYVLGAVTTIHVGFRSRTYFRERPLEEEAETEAESKDETEEESAQPAGTGD